MNTLPHTTSAPSHCRLRRARACAAKHFQYLRAPASNRARSDQCGDGNAIPCVALVPPHPWGHSHTPARAHSHSLSHRPHSSLHTQACTAQLLARPTPDMATSMATSHALRRHCGAATAAAHPPSAPPRMPASSALQGERDRGVRDVAHVAYSCGILMWHSHVSSHAALDAAPPLWFVSTAGRVEG